MAVAAAQVEDDDSWLYGNEEKPDNEKSTEQNETVESDVEKLDGKEEEQPKEITSENGEEESTKEAGEISGEDQETGVEDSDSDDDDVQVTIKDITTAQNFAAYGAAPVSLNITKRTPYAQTAGSTQPNNITVSTKGKGIDIDTQGSINGVPSYEFNLDNLEEKPWLKPGADITDYFNYGFQEDTWKAYCEKQKRTLFEATMTPSVIIAQAGQEAPAIDDALAVNENSKYTGPTAVPVPVAALKKAGPPPGRKMSGCIDVIGGGTPTALASRRVSTSPPKEIPIQVMTSRSSTGAAGGLPPGITSMPPPGFMGSPNMNMPPPGMIPPGMPGGHPFGSPRPNLSVPPPNFQDPFAYNRYPPPVHGKSDDDRSQKYDESYTGSYDRERDSRRDHDRRDSPSRTREERHRDPGRERGRSRSPEDYEGRRRREHRERDYEYDRREKDRDRERRHRDRDRDKDREERREEKHRSKRKHHRDDDEDHEREEGERHRSSRHKKKKSRKDREEEEETVSSPQENTEAESVADNEAIAGE